MPPSYYFIFTLKQDMITSCRGDGAQWKLIKMGPGAPTEGGSRQLLEWAKSKAAAEAGCGLDQAELERFAKRVVTLFTEQYAKYTHKGGKVVEGGTVSAPMPEACALLRHADGRFPRSLDIFDFSERSDGPRVTPHVATRDSAPHRPRPPRAAGTACATRPRW